MKKQDEELLVYRVSSLSIVGNVLLAVFKLVAGIFGHSSAMISDSIHSLSDVFSTIIVIVGVRFSLKEADTKHPYGHERLECVASILLAISLAVTGFSIGYLGISKVLTGEYVNFKTPGLIAIVAAIFSIVLKEIMYQYTIKVSKQLNLDSLKADAWHHRTDAFSSVFSLIAIVGARLGFLVLDSLASVIISIIIVKIAISIFRESLDKMLDCSVSIDIENEIKSIIKRQKGVIKIDDLKTRMFGSKMYVDVEISVDGKLSLVAAHKIAHKVHDAVEEKFKICKHCMVHVNPYIK